MTLMSKLYKKPQKHPISTLDLTGGVFQVNRVYAIHYSRRLLKWEKRACQLISLPILTPQHHFPWEKKASSPVPLMRSPQAVIYFTKQYF